MADDVSIDLVPSDLKDREEFVARLQSIYPDHPNEILDRLAQPDRYVSFWLNPLVPDAPSIQGEGIDASPLLKHTDREAVTHSTAAETGALYIQNPSSHFAVQCLEIEANLEVLDLAAAPGGKTIAIAALMGNTGRVAAVEPVAGRFHRLRANVERCGVSCVDFYKRDGRTVGRAVPESFDRVILDAPCSSEARMRWHDASTYKHWQLRKIKETQSKQKALIMSAYQALKPGGLMVYCTCSFAPEENELVVAHLLKRTSAELLDIDIERPTNAQPGLASWRGKTLKGPLTKTVRIVPDMVWDGFFVAKVRKPAC